MVDHDLKKNLTKTLPGEAVFIISFSEVFIRGNLDNIPLWQLPYFGWASLLAAFLLTFLLKYKVTGAPASSSTAYRDNSRLKNLLITLVVSIQAVAYSTVVLAVYMVPEDYLLLVKYLSILLGLFLSGVGTVYSDNPKPESEPGT